MKKYTAPKEDLALVVRKVLLEDEFYVGSPLGISLVMSKAIKKHIKSITKKMKRKCRDPLCDKCDHYNMALSELNKNIK